MEDDEPERSKANADEAFTFFFSAS